MNIKLPLQKKGVHTPFVVNILTNVAVVVAVVFAVVATQEGTPLLGLLLLQSPFPPEEPQNNEEQGNLNGSSYGKFVDTDQECFDCKRSKV